MPTILIGVQARSTSARFPGKSLELVDSVSMTEAVLNNAQTAGRFLAAGNEDLSVVVALLIPTGDILKARVGGVAIIEGPEGDVLRRYRLAAIKYQPQYIVRLTGDCPLIPPDIISRHVMLAMKNNLDYISNVDPLFRTSIDGHDCEVMSRRLLDHICLNATKLYDKEHVTTMVREDPPPWAKLGAVINRIDLSDIKLSVDTRDDLERVRRQIHLIDQKIKKATDRRYEVYRI